MRKIAAFYADTHREAQAVLKHIDGDVLEKMDFYLDAVGCRENPEEHSCEYAFREFCYGSPKTKKQLVIHDFVAPMDKEIVVPSLTYNYRSNLELELGQADLGVVLLPSHRLETHRYYDEILEPLRRWDWSVILLVLLPTNARWEDISRMAFYLKKYDRIHYAFCPWKSPSLTSTKQRRHLGALLTEFLRQTILRVGWGGNFYDDYADITAFFDHMDFLCYGSVRSERGERYAALPCHSGEQQTFLGMKTWEFRQMDNE